ncbi:quinone oxidoreductase family protein [Streptomyces sp. 8L]|uniref:quinone oxidoreductase family protein n=1 Tax=Streptomyces sp. 8L TaxID=2877242 RepID=UPI001CD61F47|nr:zinc-binding dehydrogenase [Streptomyces sp. 8L]MCA1224350.1 zinc-binding dehydrogenase [Streptomyces sp. 8L]
MRRIRWSAYGDPGVLTLEEAAVPDPGPGQVRIRAEAVGANYVDTLMRRGPAAGELFVRPLPGRPTGDVTGVVDAVGDGVDPALTGRRVASLVARDAYADQVLADAEWLAPVPDGLDDGMATMLPMGGPVALGALRLGRLAKGESVLVHSAAGGIGHLAVQLAKALGAGTVIGTASTAAGRAFARETGADAVVDYTAADWCDRVRAHAPGGVDVALDTGAGAGVLAATMELLAPFGRAVTYGVASGQPGALPVMSVVGGLKSLAGYGLLALRSARPEQARQDVADVTALAADGTLTTHVHARVPLAEAARAHRLLEDRAHLGRVLLIP